MPRRPRQLDAQMSSSIAYHRNVFVDGRRTSIRLPHIMWEALIDIAERRGLTPQGLINEIHLQRGPLTFSAAIRLYLVDFYHNALVQAERHAAQLQPRRPSPQITVNNDTILSMSGLLD